MAASISQTRYDYKIQLKQAIKDGKIVTVGFEKCPLCCENKRELFCDVCVNEGLFVHTQRNDGPRYQDKKKEWLAKKCKRKDIVDKLKAEVASTERANVKRNDIELVKQKIKLLKKALAETKSKCETEKTHLTQRKRIRRTFRLQFDHQQQYKQPDLRKRIANLSRPDHQYLPSVEDLHMVKFDKALDLSQLRAVATEAVTGQPSEIAKKKQEGTSIDPKSVPVLHNELMLYNHYLAIQRKKFLQDLSKWIFPMKEVLAINESHLEMSMATALKDASETAFIAGRWVHVDLRGENHCEIVKSTLPEYSGDSCALGLFVMATRYTVDSSEKIPVGNPSYGILGALTHTAMFVSLAANLLEIHLPRKCTFKEIWDFVSEQDFCNFVWRLHENILYLCVSQGVDPGELVDYLSLRNFMLCINSPSLGQVSGFDTNYSLPFRADICALEYESDDDVDHMDVSKDWERVPSGIPAYDTSSMGASEPVDQSSTTSAFYQAAANITTQVWDHMSQYFKSK